MKKFLAGMMAIGVAFGLFAAKSVLYAEEPEQIETELQTQEQEEIEAWVAWRADLAGVLEADEQYVVARAAVKAYKGDDEEERASLEAAREEIYYAIARPVYEGHFGPWDGSDEEFVAFLSAENEQISPQVIQSCSDNAVKVCGKSKVKSMTVTKDSCSFECGGGTPTATG